MILDRFNFMVDPLYGCYKLDPLVRALMTQPEIQRLRDIRLSNINSIFLPGGSNISRYEHSIGVAYLAGLAADSLSLSRCDRLSLASAALLHDVGITPFGHLMEEAFRWAGVNFDHERRLKAIFVDGAEIGNFDAPIFRGRPAGVRKVLNRKEFKDLGVGMEQVFEIKEGKGAIGAVLNGTIDIDNIDNVCRMAHHIGLPSRHKLGIELVSGFYLENGLLAFDAGKISLIYEWLLLRERLYDILMTNPFDFVSKAMMIEAMRIALVGAGNRPPALVEDDWKLTDSELVARLLEFPPSSSLVDALMRGDLHGLHGLFWIEPGPGTKRLLHPSGIQELRSQLAIGLGAECNELLVYMIKDKRVRKIDNLQIQLRSKSLTAMPTSVGVDSRRYLFGVCSRVQMNVTTSSTRKCYELLASIFGDTSVIPCDPNASIRRVFEMAPDEQPTLF